MILYSRLDIMNASPKIKKYIKGLIIYNVLFSHLPTTIFVFGSNLIGTKFWVDGYSFMEKLQLTMFFIQEVILAAVYIHLVRKVPAFTSQKVRATLLFTNLRMVAH